MPSPLGLHSHPSGQHLHDTQPHSALCGQVLGILPLHVFHPGRVCYSVAWWSLVLPSSISQHSMELTVNEKPNFLQELIHQGEVPWLQRHPMNQEAIHVRLVTTCLTETHLCVKSRHWLVKTPAPFAKFAKLVFPVRLLIPPPPCALTFRTVGQQPTKCTVKRIRFFTLFCMSM